jgi:hypothetical protein
VGVLATALHITAAETTLSSMATAAAVGDILVRNYCTHSYIHYSVQNTLYDYYHYVWSILSSHILSVNPKIRKYKRTCIILHVVLHELVTLSVNLREERRLRVPENRMLMRIF